MEFRYSEKNYAHTRSKEKYVAQWAKIWWFLETLLISVWFIYIIICRNGWSAKCVPHFGVNKVVNLHRSAFQPYRTTPLVLPGAKVKKDAPTTESYLRHYPNPAVRAHPGHDYHDSIMKQRVADTMLHKVVGSEADTGRVSTGEVPLIS